MKGRKHNLHHFKRFCPSELKALNLVTKDSMGTTGFLVAFLWKQLNSMQPASKLITSSYSDKSTLNKQMGALNTSKFEYLKILNVVKDHLALAGIHLYLSLCWTPLSGVWWKWQSVGSMTEALGQIFMTHFTISASRIRLQDLVMSHCWPVSPV